MKGFSHSNYAASLAQFGSPRFLQSCQGWILERSIPGTTCRDAMGCYPLFICRNWSQLSVDLKNLEKDLVSLSLVTDPFGQYDLELLHECFDIVIPFKEHFIADLTKPRNTFVSSHHRYYARKALRTMTVDINHSPLDYIEEWLDLYGALSQRFDIGGLRAFSRNAFEKQLAVPGAVMFRALYQGTAVGAHLAYAQDEVCYGHLAGITSAGQKMMASYALYWTELDYFAGKTHWIDWGGGAGIKHGDNGLTHFKRGWSTETRTAYFCGRIFDRRKYDEIVNNSGVAPTEYFPAYRVGEFG